VAIGFVAASDGEKFFLKAARDRAGHAFANLDMIDGADGRDFDRRADKEKLLGYIKHFAGNDLLLDGDVQVAGELDDGVARNARQNAGAQRRRKERAVVHDEDVFAGTFADVTGGIQSDAFDEAV